MTGRLFVFGMFRSGTTLLARMLDTHRDIVCASDPFRPFYNAFRDDVAASLSIDADPYDPLGSYFADDGQRQLYEAIQTASLDRSFTEDREELLDRIRNHSRPFSPYIADALTEAQLSGETYAEVLDELYGEIPEQYGTGDEQWNASKEVWTTEFVPVLERTDTDSKFVLVVRDPRAVCASKFSREEKYPWLFLARQWRKLALLTRYYDLHLGDTLDNVLVIRYEDLVTEPEYEANRICEFLDIDLDERMLNPRNFTDGEGNPWIQNTSYEDEEPSFNTDSIRKWADQLERNIVEYIERLTFAEMSLFDYDHEYVSELGFTEEELFDPPTIPSNHLADWIREYRGETTAVEAATEMGREEVRHRLLRTDETRFDALADEFVCSYFLENEVARDCRAVVNGTGRDP